MRKLLTAQDHADIKELYNSGISQSKIAKDYNESGYGTNTGEPLRQITISNILHDKYPVYSSHVVKGRHAKRGGFKQYGKAQGLNTNGKVKRALPEITRSTPAPENGGTAEDVFRCIMNSVLPTRVKRRLLNHLV